MSAECGMRNAESSAASVYPALHFTKVLSVFLGAFAVLCRHHGVAARGVLRFESGVFAVGDSEFRLADVDSVTVEGDRVVIDTLPNGVAHVGSRKGQA